MVILHPFFFFARPFVFVVYVSFFILGLLRLPNETKPLVESTVLLSEQAMHRRVRSLGRTELGSPTQAPVAFGYVGEKKLDGASRVKPSLALEVCDCGRIVSLRARVGFSGPRFFEVFFFFLLVAHLPGATTGDRFALAGTPACTPQRCLAARNTLAA